MLCFTRPVLSNLALLSNMSYDKIWRKKILQKQFIATWVINILVNAKNC